MKNFLRILFASCLLVLATFSNAQCPGGYSNSQVNWDWLDYFTYTGNYTSANGYLSSNALVHTQNFSIGNNRLTITQNFADASVLGENTSHTGEAGSYGTGADINFNANGTITLSFETEVRNVKFSIYDLDNSQSATVTATNAASVAQTITMAKANGTSAIVIAGSGTISALATSAVVGNIANNLNTAVINIDVAGPVKDIVITMGGTAGDYWISDITACILGSLPTNYYNVSKPFTGQAGYILHAFDKSVYALNPQTGVTKLLFTDPLSLGASSFVNSLAYDPYKRVIYYVFSLTATPATNKMLRKYDFNTETISTVLADINTIGVPTTSFSGVESGAAAFYNGSLYLGVETPNSGRTSGREAIIWRIDFDASNNPYRASQAWGTPADNGAGVLMHDWSDFAINDGIIYDFDGAGTTTQTDIYEYNMATGASLNFALPAGFTPGQPAVDWNGNVYQLHAINPGTAPYVAPYNKTLGTLGVRTNITSTPMYTPAIPSLGDGGEGFRPLCDFGDSPSTYDPSGADPAVHELDSNLFLGTSVDKEWLTRGQTALANSDNFDDALSFIPTFNPLAGQYLTEAYVTNKTGANATLIAWLDYNGNGLFDAAEAKTFVIPSAPGSQAIWLYWTGISTPLVNGSTTYMRIRVTYGTNGMTSANSTGFYYGGEVEDFRILVNSYALQTELISFDANKTPDHKVQLNWTTMGEEIGTSYELERSTNGQNWTSIYQKAGSANASTNNYSYADASPVKGLSYYRLAIINPDGSKKYSQIRPVNYENQASVLIAPNPATDVVKMLITSERSGTVKVQISDISGRLVKEVSYTIEQGTKTIQIPVQQLVNGLYSIQIQLDKNIYHQNLVIKK